MTTPPVFLAPSIQAQLVDIGGSQPAPQSSGDVLNFSMKCQEEDQWCWAAVAQAVEAWGSRQFSQSEIASRHIDPASAALVCAHPLNLNTPGGSTCQPCGSGCGGPHSLGSVLAERARLVGSAVPNAPSFTEIKNAISGNRPLPIRISWSGGGGHFICITGYAVDATGVEWVTVVDPLHPSVGAPNADPQDLRYDIFVSAYPAGDGSSGRPNYLYWIK